MAELSKQDTIRLRSENEPWRDLGIVAAKLLMLLLSEHGIKDRQSFTVNIDKDIVWSDYEPYVVTVTLAE